MREIGAFEVQNKLGQLLDLVEQGEEVVITWHGKAVARLVPPTVRTREAAQRIHELNRGFTLEGLSLKDLVDEGRR